jgi:small conductance mechanosensitive channel
VFDARGIEIPFPHVTLYMGELKDGTAPALSVRAEAIEIASAKGAKPGAAHAGEPA